MRLTYLRPGRESGWDVLGAVARRMGIGRGDLLEGWAFYGWLAASAARSPRSPSLPCGGGAT